MQPNCQYHEKQMGFDLFVGPESQQLLVNSLPILRQQASVAAYQ